MGRTVLPIAQTIQREREEWSKFRRVLRKQDQKAFDEMLDAVKYHAAACAYASRAVPTESIFMSVLLEHQKTIMKLRVQVKELEKTLRETETAHSKHNACPRPRSGDTKAQKKG